MSEEKLRDYLKRVTSDLHRTRLRVQELEEQRPEPIAIVGMACRFPGGVDLAGGALGAARRAAATRSPTSRPTAAGTSRDLDPDPGVGSHVATAVPAERGRVRRGLLRDLAARGARHGPAAAAAAGDLVGGARARRHRPGSAARQRRRRVRRRPTARTTRSAAASADAERPRRARRHRQRRSVLSGRIAYVLGPGGPGGHRSTPPARRRWSRCTWRSQALRRGECSLALAGGVTVMSTAGRVRRVRPPAAAWPPTAAARRSPTTPTAPAGARASACSARAPLRRASATGHRVLAVVRGSAVNQDGASNGLTAPNGPSQQRVIRAALADARLGRRRRRRRRGARHRHDAGRPDRGAGAARHVRPGPRRRSRCGSARSSRTSGTPRPPPASPA